MKRVTMLLLLLTGAGAAVAVTVSFLPTSRVDAQPPQGPTAVGIRPTRRGRRCR